MKKSTDSSSNSTYSSSYREEWEKRRKFEKEKEIEEALAEKYKPCKTYTDLLTNIFASNFVEYGVLKFSARKGH